MPQNWQKTKEAQMSKLAELTQANNVLAIATEDRFAVIAENVTADQLCKIEEIVLPTQPAYAVGDWVQCGIMQAEIIGLREILNGRQIYHMKEADGTEYDADSSALVRKLSSSEVRVKITLEGTVRKSQLAGCFVLDTPLPGNDVHTIRFADIDTATASMVKELLEKQEVDNEG
jgi:hypothetical protein